MVSAILERQPLGFQWPVFDPFLFCVHHDDRYPAGNERLGPQASLTGRNIGMDFELKDGWRMYHGSVVPGFPQHPHRGFETVTIARRGFIDHSDSLGAAARYGQGDVQWLTAGSGIVHAEMFPLLERDKENPVELFQLWLNLPRANKMAAPHFKMFWHEQVPTVVVRDGKGPAAHVTVVAGTFSGTSPLSPPPDSYAARPGADVAIWTLKLEPGAALTLPAASGPSVHRTLYFFSGSALRVGSEVVDRHAALRVLADEALPLEAGPKDPVEVLVLQGKPLGEPVAHHGPFVMNSSDELRQAFIDYQRTEFGGWPWRQPDPVHARKGRFARHPDGKVEERG